MTSRSSAALAAAVTISLFTGQAFAQRRPVTSTPFALQARANAPVAPEAIYVGLDGAKGGGLSVIDLNGFGQGTGDLAATNFLLNPNVGFPGLVPSLFPGTSSLDAGGAGALTLTENERGDTRLFGNGRVGGIREIQIGQPLDLVFNNANINPNAAGSNQINPATGLNQPGNTISVAPHPNPPRLVVPAPNPAFGIEAQEPTVTSSSGPAGTVVTSAPPCLGMPPNSLVAGNPFSSSQQDAGLFGVNFPGVFVGPQPAPGSPPPPIPFCPYTSRQQIGHFLYALDSEQDRVLILNSNRFTLLGELVFDDPVAMSISPNLEVLAVAELGGTIEFVDIDPLSATFHTVIAQTMTGAGPKTLAWQPEGEDLLVANQQSSTLTVIAPSFSIRSVLSSQFLSAPIDVVTTARQSALGFVTGVYYAFVLNQNGTIAVFESGPTSIGYDDVIGLVQGSFPGAVTLQPDVTDFGSACWVAHLDPATLQPAVSRFALTTSAVGPQPIAQPTPGLRGRQWTVTRSISGFAGAAILDLAFDDIVNHGASPDVQSPLVPGINQSRHSGKGHRKFDQNAIVPAHDPILLFVATTDAVDVVELETGNVLRTISVRGVTSLSNYWRQ